LRFAVPESGDRKQATFDMRTAEAIVWETRVLLNNAIAAAKTSAAAGHNGDSDTIAADRAFAKLAIGDLNLKRKQPPLQGDGGGDAAAAGGGDDVAGSPAEQGGEILVDERPAAAGGGGGGAAAKQQRQQEYVYPKLRWFIAIKAPKFDETDATCKANWSAFVAWLPQFLPDTFYVGKKLPPAVEEEDDDDDGGGHDNGGVNDDDNDEGEDSPHVLQYTLHARPSFFIAAMWRMNRERMERSTEKHQQKLFCVMPDPGGFVIGNHLQVDATTLERLLAAKQRGSPFNSLEVEIVEKCRDEFVKGVASTGIKEALKAHRDGEAAARLSAAGKSAGRGARFDLPALASKDSLWSIVFRNRHAFGGADRAKHYRPSGTILTDGVSVSVLMLRGQFPEEPTRMMTAKKKKSACGGGGLLGYCPSLNSIFVIEPNPPPPPMEMTMAATTEAPTASATQEHAVHDAASMTEGTGLSCFRFLVIFVTHPLHQCHEYQWSKRES
jgi:hypothetical protein